MIGDAHYDTRRPPPFATARGRCPMGPESPFPVIVESLALCSGFRVPGEAPVHVARQMKRVTVAFAGEAAELIGGKPAPRRDFIDA